MSECTNTIVAGSGVQYDTLLGRIRSRYAEIVGRGDSLFLTDARNLWSAYLGGFDDPAERQHHNCHTCRTFIENYGSMVTIDDFGGITSVMWGLDDVPEVYLKSVRAMENIVLKSMVNGVFLSKLATLGNPGDETWTHFHVTHPNVSRIPVTKSTFQAMAEKSEDYRMLSRAIAGIDGAQMETALQVLRSEQLPGYTSLIGNAEWLKDLLDSIEGVSGRNRKHLVWKHVAGAPIGFCHVRSNMIGVLLGHVAEGKGFEAIRKSFAEKMNPLQYRRPQAPPTAGNIKQAEAIVEKMGIRDSLRRRFARINEIRMFWTPSTAGPKAAQSGKGVFDHLTSKNTTKPVQVNLPAKTMTWVKFRDTVLPKATRINFLAPAHGNYMGFVTASVEDAPPILQWDRAESRNPVSWYVWHSGSHASQWSLPGGRYVNVAGLSTLPCAWTSDMENHGESIILVLEGAMETRQPSMCLFPNMLKSELHEVRSTIEAYSNNGRLEGIGKPHAAGFRLAKGVTWNARVRVVANGTAQDYILDRWD